MTTKRLSKEDRRQQILSAAIKVFVENDFAGATTLEIAKAAGISEVTLFRHFSSKQQIFLEAIEPILLSTLQGSISTSSELDARAKLEHILYERISLISKNHRIVKLILTEEQLLTDLGSQNFMQRILQILQDILTELGVGNTEFTLRLLMGSILSFLYLPGRDEAQIKDYVQQVVALVLAATTASEGD